MCLDRILSRRLKKAEQEGIGWKVFNLADERLYNPFFRNNRPIPEKRWRKANKKGVSQLRKREYRYISGFHIFTTDPRLDPYFTLYDVSRNRVICKVRYRNARVLGYQQIFGIHKVLTVVADEMYIIPEDRKITVTKGETIVH